MEITREKNGDYVIACTPMELDEFYRGLAISNKEGLCEDLDTNRKMRDQISNSRGY